MSIRDLVLTVERAARSEGITLPMARLRDAVAGAMYDRSYSQVLAAESAGTLRPFISPPAHVEAVAARYRVDARALARAFASIATEARASVPALVLEGPGEVLAMLEKAGLRAPGVADERCIAAVTRIARSIAVTVPDVAQRDSLSVVLTARRGVLDICGGAYLPLLKLLLGTQAAITLDVILDHAPRQLDHAEAEASSVPVVPGFVARVATGEPATVWPVLTHARGWMASDIHVIYSDDGGTRAGDYLLAPALHKGFTLMSLAKKTVYSTTGRFALPSLLNFLKKFRIKHALVDPPVAGERSSDGTIELRDAKPNMVSGMADNLDLVEVAGVLGDVVDDMGVVIETVLTPWPGKPALTLLTEFAGPDGGSLLIGVDQDGALVTSEAETRWIKVSGDRLSVEALATFRRIKPSGSAQPLTWEAIDWLVREIYAGLLPDPDGKQEPQGGRRRRPATQTSVR